MKPLVEPTAQAEVLDQAALVEQFLPLVHAVVGGMRNQLPQHADLEELASVGVTGLMAAIEKFDPEQRNTFEGYAVLRIRGAILDELRRMDAMPRTARHKWRKLQGVVADLEQRKGRAPTEEEVRVELGLTPKEFSKFQRQTHNLSFFSLDGGAIDGDEDAGNFHDLIADENQPIGSDLAEHKEQLALLADFLEALPERQQKVLALYYHEGLRLSEIAEIFAVTEARICQIHTKALGSLRKLMENVD